MKKCFLLVLFGLMLGAVPLVADDTVVTNSSDNAYEQMELLTEMLLQVKKHHVEEHDFEELVYGAIRGMLHSLDKHSAFMDPEEYKAMKEDTKGEYGGIGIQIGMRGGILTVIAPIEDTPGFRAGLQSGDKILEIDGVNTVGGTLREAVKKMRGPKGENVVLSVLGEEDLEPRDVDIIRDVIEVSSVKGARIISDGIAYLRLTQFARPTADLMHKSLKELDAKGMKALILDLRGNPGGLLDQSVFVAETFLKRKELVVSTKGREGSSKAKERKAYGSLHYRDIPLVVLVNKGSASASEIVAGAIQDHRRGVIIGQTTYGKGSVQSVIGSRSDDSAIRLTTAYYYTPSGRLIHDIGIEPDIVVEVGREEWRRIQVKRMHFETPDSYTDEDRAEYADAVDSQLERAVDLITAILIFQDRQ